MGPSFTRWLPELEPEPVCYLLPEEDSPQTGMYRVGRGFKLEWRTRDPLHFSRSLSVLSSGAITLAPYAFIVIQGLRLLPPRGESPVRQILGLLLALSPRLLRALVMGVRVRLPRARVRPSQVWILGR